MYLVLINSYGFHQTHKVVCLCTWRLKPSLLTPCIIQNGKHTYSLFIQKLTSRVGVETDTLRMPGLCSVSELLWTWVSNASYANGHPMSCQLVFQWHTTTTLVLGTGITYSVLFCLTPSLYRFTDHFTPTNTWTALWPDPDCIIHVRGFRMDFSSHPASRSAVA